MQGYFFLETISSIKHEKLNNQNEGLLDLYQPIAINCWLQPILIVLFDDQIAVDKGFHDFTGHWRARIYFGQVNHVMTEGLEYFERSLHWTVGVVAYF